MQSAMQMPVARFASKDPRILHKHNCLWCAWHLESRVGVDTNALVAAQNAGVLQLRFRMTAKNKQQQR